MTENKLQVIARTLGGWIIASKGAEKGTLAEVLAMVTEIMGRDHKITSDNDPVFWFDPMGRFCTRAQTKEEIENSMILMAIAEGVSIDAIGQEDTEFFDRTRTWSAFQEVKLKYMEERMRVKELEKEQENMKAKTEQSIPVQRIADTDHLKKLIFIAMDLAGMESITKEELGFCLDTAPTLVLEATKNTRKEVEQ